MPRDMLRYVMTMTMLCSGSLIGEAALFELVHPRRFPGLPSCWYP